SWYYRPHMIRGRDGAAYSFHTGLLHPFHQTVLSRHFHYVPEISDPVDHWTIQYLTEFVTVKTENVLNMAF
ncbi:MAG: hypothetical protein MI862_25760, partial [Desulfobacterales bacterium]|nr:hypothetical protein [Desulfobacterales bacterium]